MFEKIGLLEKTRDINEELNRCKNKDGIVDYNILISILRIFIICDFVSYDTIFYFTKKNLRKLKEAINSIYSDDYVLGYVDEFYKKYISTEKPFFEQISKLELEIYSRCNFSVSYNLGTRLIEKFDFSNGLILELGGNSGGLSTAIAQKYYTSKTIIIDSKVPCIIGNEFKKLNGINNIMFINADFFKVLPVEKVNYIIAANILHDFTDDDCKSILNNVKKNCLRETKLLLIEDFLLSNRDPETVVLSGLRLSVNTKTGRQRTISEIEKLLNQVNYRVTYFSMLSNTHSLVIAEIEGG